MSEELTATPLPLPASAPRSQVRFTIAGLPGVWKLAPEQPTGTGATVLDVTRLRCDNSTLAALGSRLAEFIREDD